MKEKWLFEYWPNLAPKSIVVTLHVKLLLFPKFSDGFRQKFYGTYQIHAKERTESCVLIAYAVHELSQKSGRRGDIYPQRRAG